MALAHLLPEGTNRTKRKVSSGAAALSSMGNIPASEKSPDILKPFFMVRAK